MGKRHCDWPTNDTNRGRKIGKSNEAPPLQFYSSIMNNAANPERYSEFPFHYSALPGFNKEGLLLL